MTSHALREVIKRGMKVTTRKRGNLTALSVTRQLIKVVIGRSMKRLTGEKAYACTHCGKISLSWKFEDAWTDPHMRKALYLFSMQQLICVECSFTQNWKVAWEGLILNRKKKHLKLKVGQLEFKYCQERMHSEERVYICYHCDKRFINSESLKMLWMSQDNSSQ